MSSLAEIQNRQRQQAWAKSPQVLEAFERQNKYYESKRRMDFSRDAYLAGRKFNFLPDDWLADDLKEFGRIWDKLGWSAAERWSDVRAKESADVRGLLRATDDDLRAIAEKMSSMCDVRLVSWGKTDRAIAALYWSLEVCGLWGVVYPSEGLTAEGKAARLCSPEWWCAGLRKSQKRQLEAEARRRGYVHVGKGLYCSDNAMLLRRAARRRCANALNGLELVGTETGVVLSMADVVGSSLANPDNRRAELMTRIRGFEEIAQQRGDICEFVTLTCPSKYHARRRNGHRNSKWSGATPRDAQRYLCKVWARIRAHWRRMGLVVYGLRIAEPHHDGTPHWHLALFVSAWGSGVVRESVAFYALEEDGEEEGAQENRVKFVSIDPAKGSAAGYVLKYVCKNLGGVLNEADFESGDSSESTAERVEAWASTWGIRQFQQIGGHAVGVWRELRRVPELDGNEPVPLDSAWKAANPEGDEGRADWAGFVNALGGVETRRKDALVALLVDVEERLGRYGMDFYDFPLGVVSEGVERRSERERWLIRQGRAGA